MIYICKTNMPEAFRRYSVRVIASMSGYTLAVLTTTSLIRHHIVAGWPVYPLAVLPALFIIGLFWVIGKLVIDLQDDGYQQMLMVKTVLWSTGFILSLSTIWDFLVSYANMPPMPPFVISIGWIAGFGLWGAVVRWIYK